VDNEQAQLVTGFQRNAQGQFIMLDTMPIDDAQELGVWLTGIRGPSAAPLSARFRLESGETFILTAKLGSDALWPGATVDTRLAWQGADNSTWPQGLIAFVHLRRDGTNRSQQDGLPRYFVIDPLPTAGKWADWRQLTVPVEAAPFSDEPGIWQVVVGLYDPVQGTRLPIVDVMGNVIGEEMGVGQLTWREAPVPDQSCALIPATCAAQGVE
jgi:hypothetical protein